MQEDSQSERVFHHHHTYDVDQSEVVSVSALNPLGGDDFQYAKLVQKLQKKHEWRRTNIKVLRSVISNKLSAERQVRQALATCCHPDAEEDSIAAVDGEHVAHVPSKDLVELLAGGSLVEVEERITRFQEMLTRVQELEAEISTQSRALPKLAKDIQKRENKLKVALEKIKRKSHEIRADFRAVRQKDRLRKRIEALKLEGKYFEVNQLERLNRDRKQTVANMLPELEKRENDLKELILCSASSLRAQADEYDEAARQIVTAPPPVVPRHCYTSDFLENGHPKADDGSSMGQTEETDTSEANSDIWDSSTNDADSASVASSDVALSDPAVGKRFSLDTLRQVRQRYASTKRPLGHRNRQDEPPAPVAQDLRPYPRLSRSDLNEHANADTPPPVADENDPSRMNTAFIEEESAPDENMTLCQQQPQQQPASPRSPMMQRQIDESKHDGGGMHNHLPPHLRAQAHLQHHQHQHQHGHAHYECASPPPPLDFQQALPPPPLDFQQAMLPPHTPSRSRSRNFDETLSPVQEQDELHLATVGN